MPKEQSRNNQIETLVERPLAIPIRAHPANGQNDSYQQRYRDVVKAEQGEIMAFDRSSDADEQHEQKALEPMGPWGRFLCHLRLRQVMVNEHPANFHPVKRGEPGRT
jgi:hypothetical protein